MNALQRLAMYEVRRIGDDAAAQGCVSDEDAALSETCWEALSHITYLADREAPPPALAAALAQIDLQEAT